MNGLDIVRKELTTKYNLGAPIMGELKRIAEFIREAQPLSVKLADAHLMMGLALTQACHWQEALPELEAACDLYSAILGEDSREVAIATWALAHLNAYLFEFDIADELYEDAIQAFCFGDHREHMLACLTDYHNFLSGIVKDEKEARQLGFFLDVVSANAAA